MRVVSVNSLDVLYREAKKLEDINLRQIKAKVEMWGESPFRWLAVAASGTKGAAGKKLAAMLCRNHKFVVGCRGGEDKKNDVAFRINHLGIAVKFAMLGESGKYVFEQIRDRGYNILILLGISPSGAHVWCFRKEECLRCMKKQHGKDDRWAHVRPGNLPEWTDLEKNDKCIISQSGELDDFADTFSQKITA